MEGSGWQGAPGPHPGDLQGPKLGGGWGIPACTEADPTKQTATAADGTHATGMHSCQ